MADPFHLPNRKMPSLPGFSTDDERYCDLFEEMAIAKRDELRSRLVKIGIGFALAFIVGLLLTRPLHGFVRDNTDLWRFASFHQEEPIPNDSRIGLGVAIAFSLLLMFYEIVAFISPGLKRKEKRFAYGSLAFVAISFMFGATLAFLVTIPRWLEFLLNFNSCLGCNIASDVEIASEYLQGSLAMGIAFESLIIMVLLARLGIINPSRLTVPWRSLVMVVLVAAAIITPTVDPFNMLLLTGAFCLLYKVGIVCARVVSRGRYPQLEQYDDERHCDLFEVMAMPENRDELRSRLLKIGIGFVLAFIVGLYLTHPLLRGFLGEGISNGERYGVDPAPVSVTDFFKTGLSIAIAFSILMIYYEVIAFASPILTRKERHYAYGSLPLIGFFFLFGAAFAFLVAIPRVSLSDTYISSMIEYSFVDGSLHSFVVQLSLAVGSAFELIVIMYLLARLGIVSPMCMSACRKYAAMMAVLTAAFVTPEPFSLNMLFVALGLYLLYEVGIGFANIAARRRNPLCQQYDDETPVLAT